MRKYVGCRVKIIACVFWSMAVICLSGCHNAAEQTNHKNDDNILTNSEDTTNPNTDIKEKSEYTLAHDETLDLELIRSFVSAVNNHDIEQYISLFNVDIQKEMREFIEENNGNTDDFFIESKRELISISTIDHSFIIENDWLFGDAISSFEKFCCYYVVENVEYKEENNLRGNGEQSNLYVIVEEHNKRCLYRVSAIDYSMVEKYMINTST